MTEEATETRRALWLTALGVVFGDIGTSPLYALREALLGQPGADHPNPVDVFGVLSLIAWSLVLVISVKYLIFVLRADNHGEGGILALAALMAPLREGRLTGKAPLIVLGLFGAALLYGDAAITPAISVLSAVEGLEISFPHLAHWVLPIAVGILLALFAVQSRGTEVIGRVFGPVMLVWFLVLAALGVHSILQTPVVLLALSPHHAANYFLHNGVVGVGVFGAVFLVVTGGEALYADMGHVGRTPIRRAWFLIVLPALLLNYFGQGALVLREPADAAHPFYELAPPLLVLPVMALATLATIIASQAVISGVFSLTRQAVQLDVLPPWDIRQTSSHEAGQVYLPLMNWLLAMATIGLVLVFQSSDNLAAAYGVAVSTTMGITTLLLAAMMRRRWKWPGWLVMPLIVFFLTLDLAFMGANYLKIPDGGWLPLTIGLAVTVTMLVWRRGTNQLRQGVRARFNRSLDTLGAELDDDECSVPRVPGVGVYLSPRTGVVPPILDHQLERLPVLHETVVIMTVRMRARPRVPAADRLAVHDLGPGLYKVVVSYGFMQMPNLPVALKSMERLGYALDTDAATWFVGRMVPVPDPQAGLGTQLLAALHGFLLRNSARRPALYRLPPEAIIEVGVRVEI